MKKNAVLLTLSFVALTISMFVFGANGNLPTAGAQSGDKMPATKLTNEEMTGTYNFDRAHSNIGFRIMHMGLAEIPGNFTDYTGTINYNADDVTKSSVEFTAKVTSINTGIEPRDKHLRTADFFEVEKYPDMTFKSTKIEKKGKGFIAVGDFTLKGVTKQISLPFTINNFHKNAERGVIKIGVSALTVINRRDYGISYGKVLDNGILELADNVQVNLQIEAAKQMPKSAATK